MRQALERCMVKGKLWGGMSNQVALRYAVIRYMPYLETREFATVGVVAVCPKTGYFDYKLTPRYSRFSQFFPEFDARIYRAAISYFSEELEEIKKITLKQDLSPDSLRTLFDQITRDREAIVCTSMPRVRLVANEALGLDYLFGHYAYEKPQSMTDSQTEAFQMVMNLLDSSGISSTEAKDEKNIMEFAKGGL